MTTTTNKGIEAGELVYDHANARLGTPILSHPVARVVAVRGDELDVEWESGPRRWERSVERTADFRPVSRR